MKTTTISSYYFVSFYHKQMRRKNGMKKGTISDRDEVLSLLSIIWQTVAEHYLNNDGGVYVEHIGYLCHMMIPGRKFYVSKMTGDVCRMGTNGIKYNHTCLDFGDTKRYFHLELSGYLKSKSKEKMRSGKKYRFLYNEVMAKMGYGRPWKITKVFDDNKLMFKKRKK